MAIRMSGRMICFAIEMTVVRAFESITDTTTVQMVRIHILLFLVSLDILNIREYAFIPQSM
jgi:hypothetical protein